jgi:hypothetical protein
MSKHILDNVAAVPILRCGFLLCLFLAQPCIAHDAKHPEFDSRYPGLQHPNFKSAVQSIAVHIASRVSALAGPCEELVSRTVKDLVAGSVFASTSEADIPSRDSRNRWTSTRLRIDARSQYHPYCS